MDMTRDAEYDSLDGILLSVDQSWRLWIEKKTVQVRYRVELKQIGINQRKWMKKFFTWLRIFVNNKIDISSAANMKNILIGYIGDFPSFNKHCIKRRRFL